MGGGAGMRRGNLEQSMNKVAQGSSHIYIKFKYERIKQFKFFPKKINNSTTTICQILKLRNKYVAS